jgi:hypothetical protein
VYAKIVDNDDDTDKHLYYINHILRFLLINDNSFVCISMKNIKRSTIKNLYKHIGSECASTTRRPPFASCGLTN